MTIQSNADASGLSGCTTFTGSIAISTGTTDNIQLSGIRRITGSLIANNVTQMTSLAATDLEEIGQEFNLESLTILSTLNFPKLTKVDSISWTALPALQGLSFATGVQEVNMLTIDNTQLNALDGINLQVAETISVTNNPYLDKVSMQLGNVTQSLTFGANGRNLEAEFPNLEWAYNMTFRDCAKVSIPSLSSVNGSLGFYENGLESVSAPNLTNVGGSLAFVRNDQLSNITMPELTTIGGGFLVANNTGLGEINGFPALKTVGGALDFNGAFERYVGVFALRHHSIMHANIFSVSTFPSLAMFVVPSTFNPARTSTRSATTSVGYPATTASSRASTHAVVRSPLQVVLALFPMAPTPEVAAPPPPAPPSPCSSLTRVFSESWPPSSASSKTLAGAPRVVFSFSVAL
jgi:hypothetical protein